MRKALSAKGKRRVRPTLLVLLWVWAACILLIVDLFLNVEELDDIRPRSDLYRGMRIAAHKMVGEPFRDGDLPGSAGGALAATLLAEEEEDLEEDLLEEDPIGDADDIDLSVDIEALDRMAKLFGGHARTSLLETVYDEEERGAVRVHAARVLGLADPAAVPVLDRLIASPTLSQPERVSAIRSLGEIDSGKAAVRALAIAAGPPSALREAGFAALVQMVSVPACRTLVGVARNEERKTSERVTACRALGTFPARDEALEFLRTTLAVSSAPTAVRVAAAEALGNLGRIEALGALSAASSDPSADVAREARVALARLTGGGDQVRPKDLGREGSRQQTGR